MLQEESKPACTRKTIRFSMSRGWTRSCRWTWLYLDQFITWCHAVSIVYPLPSKLTHATYHETWTLLYWCTFHPKPLKLVSCCTVFYPGRAFVARLSISDVARQLCCLLSLLLLAATTCTERWLCIGCPAYKQHFLSTKVQTKILSWLTINSTWWNR